ncbi:MAG: DUF3379 family protein [Gammaproteobacteria bacterium]|nr:DUF3379 family protein [Gammaproteobacteria bacterium]
MQCLEFRRLCGVDPRYSDPEYLEHAERCGACAGYLQQLLRLDALILKALHFEVRLPERAESGRTGQTWKRFETGRRFGVAASLLAVLTIVAGIWLSSPGNTLASDVIAHIRHEPHSLEPGQAVVDAPLLDNLLARHGTRLAANIGTITYAQACLLRGRPISHLVVQDEAGPVTVLVLPDERVAAPMQVQKDGFHGRIIPAGKGSIAFVGYAQETTDAVEQRVLNAVQSTL